MKKILFISVISIIAFTSCNRKVIESIQTSATSSMHSDSSSYVETIVPVDVNIPGDSVEFQIPIVLDSLGHLEQYEIESNGERITVTAKVQDGKLKIKAISKPLVLTVPVVKKQTFKQVDNRRTTSKNISYTKTVTAWWVYPALGLFIAFVIFMIVSGKYKLILNFFKQL